MASRLKEKINNRIKQVGERSAQVYLAMKDQKTPKIAKLFGYLTIAYALSPIDLIPDFIPVLGYLDDIVILPILIFIFIKLIPSELWESYADEAKAIWENGKPKKWYFAIPIVIIWSIFIYLIIRLVI